MVWLGLAHGVGYYWVSPYNGARWQVEQKSTSDGRLAYQWENVRASKASWTCHREAGEHSSPRYIGYVAWKYQWEPRSIELHLQ